MSSMQDGIEHKALGGDVENKAIAPGESKAVCDANTDRGCSRHACLAGLQCQTDPSNDFSWDSDA